MTITMPYTATEAVRTVLLALGEDPDRDGLADTPARVMRALTEMTAGYAEDPAAILATTFDVSCDELVVVRDIEFVSLCEHHLLPFVGSASIGYLPGARVVGLSKLARLTQTFARRLQVQERMTGQIAEAIMEHLDARGVGVVVEASHSCMAARGIRAKGTMVTSALLGDLRSNLALRSEFLSLLR